MNEYDQIFIPIHSPRKRQVLGLDAGIQWVGRPWTAPQNDVTPHYSDMATAENHGTKSDYQRVHLLLLAGSF